MSDIALALIKQLVARCVIDADDIAEIADQLSAGDAHAVRASWLEAVAAPEPVDVVRPLRVVD